MNEIIEKKFGIIENSNHKPSVVTMDALPIELRHKFGEREKIISIIINSIFSID